MLKKMITTLCLSALISASSWAAKATSPYFQVYTTEDDFEMVHQNLEVAIENKGLVISGRLHVQEMLTRTAADLGFSTPVYTHATTITFCSALLSQRMVKLHPLNMTVCPFAVSVYSTADQPEIVNVSYRRNKLAGETIKAQALEKEITKTLENIVKEALDI